ncbi:unnamed protein product [Echinostoma caproni]|uniref:EGF_CA domain-containing protein n=1 Tax=Echinostoma caproni TaxID=27848 RepID=A0A183ATN4_9TREM|nr:unnamed protein product [Echinostoma caproni]
MILHAAQSATYEFMSTDECPIDKCLQAANRGLQLCDAGVEDCENTNTTYRCRRGVPLLDECNEISEGKSIHRSLVVKRR